MGLRFSSTPDDDYPFRHGLLEMYYSHLYAQFWNVSIPDFYIYAHLGGPADGVGDKADGSIEERDGDEWRRVEESNNMDIEDEVRRVKHDAHVQIL